MSQKHYNEIQSYWNKLTQLVDLLLLNSYSMSTKIPRVLIAPIEGDENNFSIKLECPIIFENIPYKHSTNQRLIIYLDGKCDIKINDAGGIHLKSYVTKIAYFDPPDASSETIMHVDGFHYDMEEKVQSAHPVFHVQRNPKVLDSTINADILSKYKL